jgi:hypothetical protein
MMYTSSSAPSPYSNFFVLLIIVRIILLLNFKLDMCQKII